MAEIKSALEIALARTEGVKSDREGVRLKELNESGRRKASRFLNDHKDAEKLKKEIAAAAKEDRKEVLNGIYQVFKTNLSLPQTDEFKTSLDLLKTGFTVITDKTSQLDMLFEQLDQFFGQYTQAKQQLLEGIKGQMEPLARQKSQQISQQRGMEIELRPEDLPEYAQALSENMGRLKEQFNQALGNVREELDGLLGLG